MSAKPGITQRNRPATTDGQASTPVVKYPDHLNLEAFEPVKIGGVAVVGEQDGIKFGLFCYKGIPSWGSKDANEKLYVRFDNPLLPSFHNPLLNFAYGKEAIKAVLNAASEGTLRLGTACVYIDACKPKAQAKVVDSDFDTLD
jgi:hypothetical protein